MPALVIEVTVRLSPEDDSPGARPRSAPIVVALNRVQSLTSTASPTGQGRDPSQAAQPVHHAGELAGCCEGLDLLIELVTAGLGE